MLDTTYMYIVYKTEQKSLMKVTAMMIHGDDYGACVIALVKEYMNIETRCAHILTHTI